MSAYRGELPERVACVPHPLWTQRNWWRFLALAFPLWGVTGFGMGWLVRGRADAPKPEQEWRVSDSRFNGQPSWSYGGVGIEFPDAAAGPPR